MIEFATGRDANKHIAKLSKDSDNACFAVAFWGTGASSTLGISELGDRARIICNLTMGGTNPGEIERLIKSGANVRHSPTLHAKVYLFGDAALIGSSNASANGLSLQAEECRGWDEANVLIREPNALSELGAWFEEQWEKAHTVKDTDIALAWVAWSQRRRSIKAERPKSTLNLLRALRKDPSLFDNDSLYLAIYSTQMDEDGLRAYKKAKEQEASGANKLFAFQDWDDLPDDADLLCLYSGPKGGFRCDGYCFTPRERMERPAGKGKIQICFKMGKDHPYPAPGERDQWSPILSQIKESALWDEGIIIPIREFSRSFL